MERTTVTLEMVEADLGHLARCWALSRRGGEDLPRLDRVLAQDLGEAAERVFMIERLAPAKFRFGIVSDRGLLRLGIDASGRELTDEAPWPANVSRILERAASSCSRVELMVVADTSNGEQVQLSVHLFPVAGESGLCSGFIGFAHAFGRSSEGRDEFGLIVRTEIAAAVLARPEAGGHLLHAAI